MLGWLFKRQTVKREIVVNAVALLSYMYALQPPAILMHVIWGILLAVLVLFGVGKWSVDGLMHRQRKQA